MYPFVKSLSLIVICLTLLALPPADLTHAADIRYVTDALVITLRQGPGSQYKILKTLKTDTVVEVLEDANEYLRVRTKDGIEGWVLTQYINSAPPKSKIIAGLNQQMEQLAQQNATLTEDLSAIRAQYDATLEELENVQKAKVETVGQTSDQLQEMTEQYNALLSRSEHVVEMAQENEALLTANSQLTTEVEFLKKENSELKRTGMLKWFLAGGGVFLTGFIVAKTTTKKKKYY